MDDDPEMNFLTCLCPDPHENNIRDPILHFLGCVDISTRNAFLKITSDAQPDEKVATEATAVQLETNQQDRGIDKQKEAIWREDCLSELRRIAFLRSKLEQDEEEKHLVEKIVESRQAWEASQEYITGIKEIRNWRNSSEISNEEESEPEITLSGGDYQPSRDVNTPFMLFKRNIANAMYVSDNEKSDPKDAVWGRFPNQKTNVQRLLFQKEKKNLLYGGDNNERITYFHIPSNNMLWAEEAVSRYYGEDRPNFHPIQRDIRAQEMTKAAWILKESHWRGQLHGGRSTVSSRYMRPFCESIRSFDDVRQNAADTVAQNIVLFMPYMHWETSRNQQRFSQIIENIVDKKKRNDRERKAAAREARQKERMNLRRPNRPKPFDSRSCWDRFREHSRSWKGKPDTNPGEEATSNAAPNQVQQQQCHYGPIRSMTGLLKAQAVKEKLNLSGRYPQLDQHDRVDLDAWLEDQKRSEEQRRPQNQRWFRRSVTEDSKPRYRLGQYLLDAARLFEAMTTYRDRKLLERYLMEDPPMHPRRTLDQAYYWSINNTNQRDLDQVVYRATTADPLKFHRWDVDRSIWTGHDNEDNKTPEQLENFEHKPCSECTAKIQQVSRVVMVDQLWMWVLDKKTIITCFPKRYGANKHDTSGIHKSIRMRIEEGGILVRSVFDLALIIFEECSNTFFDRTRTTDKQPQVLDEFSEAIGNIMNQQTDAFEKLWRWTERASKMYRRLPGAGVLSELHIPLLDINPEGKLEKEIKDIVEELGIMTYIKKAEKDVLRSFVDNACQILKPVDAGDGQKVPESPGVARLGEYFPPQRFENRSRTSSPARGPKALPLAKEIEEAKAARAAYQWFCSNAYELLKRVDQRIGQLEELERSAKSTAEMVKDLLELKQQQAGVVQAWQSVECSNEAMRQGRSIMVFTIVTIVFLPLSFMSSVFGMNAVELGGSDNVMHLGDQFTYIFSISAGVIILTLLFSISTSVRTLLWCIFKKSYTKLLVWTRLYRYVYLRMDFRSDEMYENAINMTEKLKANEKEKFLRRRRERRAQKENQTRADTDEHPSTQEADSRRGWPLSLLRKKAAHGSANGGAVQV